MPPGAAMPPQTPYPGAPGPGMPPPRVHQPGPGGPPAHTQPIPQYPQPVPGYAAAPPHAVPADPLGVHPLPADPLGAPAAPPYVARPRRHADEPPRYEAAPSGAGPAEPAGGFHPERPRPVADPRRHARPRRTDPKAHWILLALTLIAAVAALLFEGYTHHEVAASAPPPAGACAAPAPKGIRSSAPVLRVGPGGKVESAAPAKGTAALTFDGGPDPVMTPKLLDLLRKNKAHATFFVTGAQAARHPELVRRIKAEGHELGSYTYTAADLGSASAVRTRLELSLTRNVLAGAADVSPHLLRLPYTTTPARLCEAQWEAAERAAGDGYLIVASGRGVQQYAQTPATYTRLAKSLAAPGDKTRYTTVSTALGLPDANPPAGTMAAWQGKGLLGAQSAAHVFAVGMTWFLGLAGVLTVGRLALLMVFARTHVRRVRRARRPHAEINAPVTVIVPAYNEEAGIEQTLRSLLASTHTYLQIIVVDDGSTDRTYQIASSCPDPRVMVVRQPNAGKAAALNTGLAWAHFDLVVMIDGDTVFEPDAIGNLIQPFADPAVGAVSGNTKVGNRGGLLGRWQHLEYVIGFNLDRRMFDVLECMPTVPGAIGGFRRDALLGVGGVSEDTLAEDTDLTMALCRAGWRVVYEETAIAWTEAPASLRQLWRQRYRWCYGTLQAMWKHRGALREKGAAGRFGRRGLTYLGVFQTLLPLLAPIVDVYALYGVLFQDPATSLQIWLGFLAVQLVGAVYALRLDGERLGPLWTMPLQLFVYRQLMYLVVVQSVFTALLGSRLGWHRMQRTGTATETLRQAV
ncbi:bifunctional polysaccharide deacetylase/glycosyltransferase family 2 protein [Streptomyces sp. NPDC051940]|uniref:bifunctional polysaccharide deacetylase/glycosyltransferase family 2 protein n=1 Tax=Streptomyces sp. NPDC051940 TaxID=3155675 RepID=UPI0034456A72